MFIEISQQGAIKMLWLVCTVHTCIMDHIHGYINDIYMFSDVSVITKAKV